MINRFVLQYQETHDYVLKIKTESSISNFFFFLQEIAIKNSSQCGVVNPHRNHFDFLRMVTYYTQADFQFF